MSRRSLIAAVSSLAVAVTTALGATAAAAAPHADPGGGIPGPDRQDVGKVSSALTAARGTVTAFVQLDAPSGVEVAEAGGSKAEVKAAAEDVDALAAEVVPDRAAARSAKPAPKVIGVTSNLVAGTLVTGDAAQIRAIAASPDVVAVYRVGARTIDNKGTDVFTRALDTWQATGETGEGVRLGVIDTGIDYTHADFGGPGTEEAYAEAYGEDGSGPIPAGTFDPTKFLGGYDFAGPEYDGDDDESVPAPDANPIDAPYTAGNSGHGTHVAGTAGGFGVLEDGSTFRGDYTTLTDISDWQIGPGSAPGVGLYALKVFGDAGGSTNLTMLAYEWAADPNGDGDFNDHLDVINASLGSDGAPSDDPESLFVNQLYDLGVLAVFSAGNAGDITDIGGSPGNSQSALNVANSVGNTQTFDAVEVTAAADPALIGLHAAQNSVNYAGTADVTAPVAFVGATFDGCTAFTASEAALVAGKIAYLWWDDDDTTRVCGSAARFNNAQAAGAVGVLLGTELPVFPAGIAGNPGIPGAQLTAAETDALMPEIVAGTLTVRIGPSLAGTAFVQDDTLADTLNPGSSRGEHGSLGTIKPDVAAPGTRISSAASSGGTRPHTLSGTSMAAPHVAGIGALVRATHPGWGPSEVKAAIMNTATHDVYEDLGPSGSVYGPLRVGSGRVDALDAVNDSVIAYASADPDLVSVNFGVVEVGADPVSIQKTVTVKNLGTTSVRYATSFAQATGSGGATVTTTPAAVTVPAGASRLVTLTFTADPATLEKELDPTSEAEQGGVTRDFLTAVSGRLVLTSGAQELRVPVVAAPKLVSELSAEPVEFADAGALTAPLDLTGRGVDSGGWISLAAPFELKASSPVLDDPEPGFLTSPSVTASGDLRYVGFASTAPQLAAAGEDPADGVIGIAMATYGEWTTLGTAMLPAVDIDVDQDGTTDFYVVVQKLSDAIDATYAVTVDIRDPEEEVVVEAWPINFLPATIDSSVFDNNVLVAPVSLAGLELEPGDTPSFSAYTVSSYSPDPSTLLDAVDPFVADPFDPSFWFDLGAPDSFWTVGAEGTAAIVHRSPSAPADAQLLTLLPHNATPSSRAQVVDVEVPAQTETSTALEVTGSKVAGATLTLTATVTPSDAAGTVRFLDGSTEIATAPVEDGVATATATLGAGKHALSAVFAPATAAWTASTSPVVEVEIRKSSSTTSFTLSAGTAPYGTAVTATVVVTGKSAAPTGTVEIRERGKVLGTGELVVDELTGTATIALPADLAAGRHTLTAVYGGNADVKGSSAQRRLTVTSLHPKVTLSAASWTVPPGATPEVTVTVTGPAGAPTPTGKVTLVVGSRVAATVTLDENGTGTATLPAITRSTIVTAYYDGDRGYGPGLALKTLRVS